jgi:hypothetical protein
MATKTKPKPDLRLPFVDADKRPFIRCRTLGHSWFDYDSNWTPKWGTPLTLRCERCGMERRDTVSFVTGQLLNRRYKKPDNYGYGRGESPTRSEFRRLLLEMRGVTDDDDG